MSQLPPARIARENLRSLVNFVITSSLVVGIAGIPLVPSVRNHLIGVISAIAIVLIVREVSKRQLVAASILLTLLAWISVSILVLQSGGFESPFLVVFIVVVMIGSIFLGRHGAILSLLATLASIAIANWLTTAGLSPVPTIQYMVSDQAIVIAMLIIIVFGTSLLLGNTVDLTAQLEDAYEETLVGYVRSLEFRDGTTQKHSNRVVEITVALASTYPFSKTEIENISRGALLHDIGKIGISDSILLKPGLLDDRERKEMERHPLIAKEMLSGVKYLEGSLPIPIHHHEKWDGNGYPQGLIGEEIPLEARIFAVADVWDALISDRPYRSSWSKDAALSYIQENSGVLFDPEVVGKFTEYLKSDG